MDATQITKNTLLHLITLLVTCGFKVEYVTEAVVTVEWHRGYTLLVNLEECAALVEKDLGWGRFDRKWWDAKTLANHIAIQERQIERYAESDQSSFGHRAA